jgi:transposase
MSKGKSAGAKRARRAFPPEFKDEAVRLVQERRAEGVSLSQIARELDVGRHLLQRWMRDLAERPEGEADERAPASETESAELRRLRRENAVLRQERDFLKKATAFFAKESR